MPYIKANQAGIVILVLAALAFREPWILAALWVIQTAGLLLGGQWNLFVRIAKPYLAVSGRQTQALELQRFNNTLAVLFLTLSLIAFALGWTIAGYVFALMLLAAAGAALMGVCIGCVVYFQYKQFIARRRLRT
ncbi:hypothetical protein GCM10010911_51610 [Paenibacillus nasutitermitis]|uniref:DUF4395 domain-containing protein n=2 Tax=Paenibacillus nasutitermitis TaxID=1652958 RepID=A0A916ZCM0_9BACL|nr:hypothetical protein GCM10010911_51610 [Paenibacillus nasutitermitis]